LLCFCLCSWVDFLRSCSVSPVACVWRRGDRPSTLIVCVSGKYGETRNSLSLISGKREWKSPPSILVTRNPNWSQRSGKETDCVKGRY
jgi:hypothetical protein